MEAEKQKLSTLHPGKLVPLGETTMPGEQTGFQKKTGIRMITWFEV